VIHISDTALNYIGKLCNKLTYLNITGVSFTPLTPNTVELIPTLGALFRGGPVQDPVSHVPPLNITNASRHRSVET